MEDQSLSKDDDRKSISISSSIDHESTIYLSDDNSPSLVLPSNLNRSVIDSNLNDETLKNEDDDNNDNNNNNDISDNGEYDADDDDDNESNCSDQANEEKEEVEPKLTYTRMAGDVPEIVKKETLTYMTVHEKFFILGTHSGKMFLLTFNGEICSNNLYSLHRSSINQISIDDKADFIGSCSDHKVVINELYSDSTEPHYLTTFDRPVKTFSIDPQYATTNSRCRFLVGEADRVLLFEKNLIGRYKVTCLQQARGIIRSSSWRKNFIVWASDLCLKIYDVPSKTIITHLDREKERDYRIKSDLFQCYFTWKNDKTILITWGNSVKVCEIKQKPEINSELNLTSVMAHASVAVVAAAASSTTERIPKYYVELMNSFTIEENLIACSVAPIGDNLMVLCANRSLFQPKIFEIDPLLEKKMVRIQLMEPKNSDLYEELSDDILPPNDFLKTVQKSRDICVQVTPEQQQNFYLILCPKDLIVVRPREEDDSIDWLLSRNKYYEAYLRIKYSKKSFQRHTLYSVGERLIKYLLEQNNLDLVEKAGTICSELCRLNPNLWETYLKIFKSYNCLRVLIKYLPNGSDGIKLKPSMYEMLLLEFLKKDSQDFLNLIELLPPSLYNTSLIIDHTLNQLSTKSSDKNLLNSLGELYTFECRYNKALLIFLQAGNSKKVFNLIRKHNLFNILEDRIIELLQLDSDETSRLLILNQDTVQPEKVVIRLKKHPQLLCTYLDRLIHRDPTTTNVCSKYHDLLLDLYAEYEPKKIVPFVRLSPFIQLNKALQVCKKQELTDAIVIVLGRMGKTHEALRLIIEKKDDINAAIQFCKEQNDKDLWAELMDISVSKPHLLSTLLRNVGSVDSADPINLIARIPNGLEVPDLVPSIVKILEDNRIKVSLEEGCHRVLKSDCHDLMLKLYKIRAKAIFVRDQDRYCHVCQSGPNDLIAGPIGKYILFQCGHLFHIDCLQIFNNINNNHNEHPNNSLNDLSKQQPQPQPQQRPQSQQSNNNNEQSQSQQIYCHICHTNRKKFEIASISSLATSSSSSSSLLLSPSSSYSTLWNNQFEST